MDDAVEKLLALGALKRVWPSTAAKGKNGDEKEGEGKSKSRASQQKSGPTAEHDGVAITSLGKVRSSATFTPSFASRPPPQPTDL